MNILLITHSFAPAVSPRAIRWRRVIERLLGNGHEIHVVCGREPGSKAFESVKGIRVYRCGGGLIERMRRHVKKVSPSSGQDARVHGFLGAAAKWCHDRLWKRIYWPDSACLWCPAAFWRAVRVIRTHAPDVMISVSPPFSGHLVALSLHRWFPRLPWLVDIGDPFSFLEGTELNNPALYRRLNHWVEGRVTRGCDAISVTTAQQARMYVDNFEIEPAKMTVIPPILAPGPAPLSIEGAGRQHTSEIVLLYAGSFYSGLREPDSLIALLERVLELDSDLARHLRFDICGDMGQFRARFTGAPLVGSIVRFHGVLCADALAARRRNADVLVNVGNMTSYQLPSKIVEYMAECKPILNVCQIAADSSAQLLSAYPAALSVLGGCDSATLASVASFLRRAPATRINPEQVAGLVHPFQPDGVAHRYEDVLHSLVSGREVGLVGGVQ
jgi:hypothetical protein